MSATPPLGRSLLLVATWRDGVFVLGENERGHEFPGRSVRGLTADGQGGALAIVEGRTLQRRARDGAWSLVATADCELACCVVTHGTVYLGTDDARVFRVGAEGALVPLPGSTT